MNIVPIPVSTFVISLDFELFWGVRDVSTTKKYRKNLEGVHQVIPEILMLFTKYNIQATWATVGFLFLNNFNEIAANIPRTTTKYAHPDLSPYPYIKRLIANNEHSFLKLHFAPDLIKQISTTPNQEIASHTFSHFYCLEKGQTCQSFEEDLVKNLEIAQLSGIQLKSIVFPRNQVNKDYESILRKHGITSYRGLPKPWIYQSGTTKNNNSYVKRGLRYLDTFFKICTIDSTIIYADDSLLNIPASRFLQPFNNRPFGLERLKLNRIKSEMTQASEKKSIYHLWWHPHNFGKFIPENLTQLEEILIHYAKLNKEGKMASLNMQNIAHEFTGR